MNTFFKILTLLVLAFVFAGCDTSQTGVDTMTDTQKMRIVCLDGVEYYLYREGAGYAGYGYMSVKFNRDGTIATCYDKDIDE